LDSLQIASSLSTDEFGSFASAPSVNAVSKAPVVGFQAFASSPPKFPQAVPQAAANFADFGDFASAAAPIAAQPSTSATVPQTLPLSGGSFQSHPANLPQIVQQPTFAAQFASPVTQQPAFVAQFVAPQLQQMPTPYSQQPLQMFPQPGQQQQMFPSHFQQQQAQSSVPTQVAQQHQNSAQLQSHVTQQPPASASFQPQAAFMPMNPVNAFSAQALAPTQTQGMFPTTPVITGTTPPQGFIMGHPISSSQLAHLRQPAPAHAPPSYSLAAGHQVGNIEPHYLNQPQEPLRIAL
jgi:hypothetical protein